MWENDVATAGSVLTAILLASLTIVHGHVHATEEGAIACGNFSTWQAWDTTARSCSDEQQCSEDDFISHEEPYIPSQDDVLLSRSRTYADVNVRNYPEYWDYENTRLHWGYQDDYVMVEQLGEGKHGRVYLGLNVIHQQDCVVKVLDRTEWLKREINVLRHVCGGPNIVRLLDIVRDEESAPSLVFEYVNNTDFKELYPTFTDDDVRFYIFHLLKALDYTHSKGIIHRDVKPRNVMIDHQQRKLRLIDWGMAEFYIPAKEYSVTVSTRYFKGPELLVALPDYDYSLDLWSLGCIFAGIIFDVDYFFQGQNNHDQLVKIAEVLGTEDLYSFVTKMGLELPPDLERRLGNRRRKPWSKFVTPHTRQRAVPEAIDFLDGLLRYDPAHRMTAQEAMMHPYLDPVRQQVSHLATTSAAA